MTTKKKGVGDQVKAVLGVTKAFMNKPLARITMGILLMVFVLLGTKFGIECGSGKGWNCNFGYTPPKVDDVKKVIRK